jgi:hypothetical protein
MLVKFSVSEESLRDLGTKETTRLVKFWERHGELLCSNRNELVSIAKRACVRPDSFEILRTAILATERCSTCELPSIGWHGLSPEAQEFSNGCVDVYGVSKAVLPDYCQRRGVVTEFVELSTIDVCEKLAEVEALAQQDILERVATFDIWKSHFQPLLTTSGIISVVDRYGLATALKDGNGSGLRNFLSWSLTQACPKQVKFYISDTVAKNAKGERKYTVECMLHQVKEYVEKIAPNKSTNIQIWVIQDKQFGKLSHFRYFRFGNKCLDIDVGLGVLGGISVHRRASCSLKLDNANKEGKRRRDLELELERNPLHRLDF